MAPALILALALLATDAAATDAASGGGEPLPPGAPTDPYELTGWCYGALGEYLEIYDRVKPDLIEIDKTWGTSVKESEPYKSDIAAAREELKVLANALEAAEKASPKPIAPQGAAAIKRGQTIWVMAEARPHRELARAWLTWGLPDQCGLTARILTAKSGLLGKALTYNTKPDEATPMAPAPEGPTLQPIAPVKRAGPASVSAPPPAPIPEAVASEPPTDTTTPDAFPTAAQTTDVAAAASQPRVVDDSPAPDEPLPPPKRPRKPAPAAAAPPPLAPAPTVQPSEESSEPVL